MGLLGSTSVFSTQSKSADIPLIDIELINSNMNWNKINGRHRTGMKIKVNKEPN